MLVTSLEGLAMKKIIFSLFLVLGCFLSWACNNPTQSYSGVTGPRSGSPPVATPTFALASPAYAGGVNTAIAPTGLAITGGTTYVSEAQEDGNSNITQLEVFSAGSTTAVTAYGSVTFQWLAGVANAETTIYVLDSGDGRKDGTAAVYAFTGGGVTVTTWNSFAGGEFFNPSTLAVDSLGNVYVADTFNSQVEEFNPTGTLIAMWTKYNGTYFAEPAALAFDSVDDLYVGDIANGAVYEFSSTSGVPGQTGVYQWNLDYNCFIDGLAVDNSTGNIYVADYGDVNEVGFGNGQMEEYGPNGGPQLTAWTYGTNFGPDYVLLSGGNIWVADYNNNSIDQF